MRKRFEQQTSLGFKLIEDAVIPTLKRSGSLPKLCLALKTIFITPEWNEKIFVILEKHILSKNNSTGRPGMDLWQIFVLSQVRLCLNTNYDELCHIANNDRLVRQILGVEAEYGFESKRLEFAYQRIIDNVGLLDDETVRELNNVIVEFGHGTFKKKEEEALRLKTDSFVVESNVHFPTDYNLLWDCARKCYDCLKHMAIDDLDSCIGWRKLKSWKRNIKNLMLALSRACASGSKGKEERVKLCASNYLEKAKLFLAKIESHKPYFPHETKRQIRLLIDLIKYSDLLKKHIDLVERRLIKGEEIPHEEKMFSIFETYTEWVTKGKLRPNVELGKKVAITTDQFHLIVNYKVMDNESDSQIVPMLKGDIIPKHTVGSWSFDKGFWHKENKALLEQDVKMVVMPKKGKRNKAELEHEQQPIFKKLKNKHSAVESNINELEHRGLNRCPDKGFANFKRYIGLAVCAYNLKKIGERLLDQLRKEQAAKMAQTKAA